MQAFLERLRRSRFFTISAAIHLALVVLFGGTIIFRNALKQDDFEADPGGAGLIAPPAAQAPDPVTQPLAQPQTTPQVATPSTPTQSLTAITTTSTLPAAFELPSAAPDLAPSNIRTITPEASAATPTQQTLPGGLTLAQAKAMKAFTGGWGQGSGGSGVGKDRRFKFTAYVAKYAGGDWNSTVRMRNGKDIDFGSLPNLLYLMNKWSGDRIQAQANAVPLDLSSDEIFTIKPPFIFFTGRRDFVLTGREVENLRKYIQLGGAVWGDATLPGRRSRFDLAFRREMKRVVPDVNKDFEPLPPDHPLFARTYFPEVRGVPPGLNYYQEPVYAIKIYGEVAILYTANDYGDMWQIGLTERGEIDFRKDENDNFVGLNYELWQRRANYFRNLEPKPIQDSYKFGINIVVHLLTRWEDRLRTVPGGL